MGRIWGGTKTTGEVGSRRLVRRDAAQLEKDLEAAAARGSTASTSTRTPTGSGRVEPTLDRIVALLKAKPAWKLRSRTYRRDGDGPAQPAAFREEGCRRQAYLVAAGIDATRLSTKGFGATKPAASNATGMGVPENRRVELVEL